MLELRQEQKLLPILTQQLQQAIKLLQLSKLELVEAIEQELNENPILEVEEKAQEAGEEEFQSENDDTAELLERYSASEDYAETEQKEAFNYENFVSAKGNLRDHLRWQFGLSDFEGDERVIAEWIIGNIDDNGYLAYPLPEIAAVSGYTTETLERVLKKVQKLEPPGVAARDLKECILLQYEAGKERDPIFEDIVRSSFELIAANNLKEIVKKTGYPIEVAKRVLEKIRSFDPKPGRNFSDEVITPVVPDVHVVKVKNDFEVFLNEDDLPELRMSRYYLDLYSRKHVNGEARRYIRQKIKQAQWFMNSIQQRQRTLYLVSKSIVDFQKEFLEKGIRYLKPLNLRDVAPQVGVHESTVSRITSNKYMSTPRGVFEMKFFFPTALGKSHGESLSSNVAMDLIAEIVNNEDKAKPLTDDEIVRRLQEEQGIHIARRTVVKYREILGITSSRARRSAS